LEDLRVLVVEDNIIHITLLVEQLTVGMGIPDSKITCAHDGDEAIEEIKRNLNQNTLDHAE
jgi:CheY-like chemotaxis protein